MAVQFPDESQMPRSQDGSEPIRPGSVGFNRIFGLFKDRALTDKKPFATCFVINLETIFRNNYDKKLSQKEVFDACLQDMDTFLIYLEAYLSWIYGPNPHRPIPVCVYIPDYKSIPKDLLREHPASWELMMSMYHKFIKSFPLLDTLSSYTEYTLRYSLRVGSTTYPHIELATWLRNLAFEQGRNMGFSWGDPICLISRNVIDLHIAKRIKSVLLLESYTAEIKTPDHFGTKLIKTPLIPFNIATHRAFGDAVHLKPLVMRSTKKELIDLAEKNRWMSRSYETILRDVCTVAKVPSSEIRRTVF